MAQIAFTPLDNAQLEIAKQHIENDTLRDLVCSGYSGEFSISERTVQVEWLVVIDYVPEDEDGGIESVIGIALLHFGNSVRVEEARTDQVLIRSHDDSAVLNESRDDSLVLDESQDDSRCPTVTVLENVSKLRWSYGEGVEGTFDVPVPQQQDVQSLGEHGLPPWMRQAGVVIVLALVIFLVSTSNS
jgi:hypothetical protein